MEYKADLTKLSNAYYNKGLERAMVGDLSGAAEFLKRALKFNKNCTDARNLLGLIYYECGETADALVQWVISTNLDESSRNLAIEYLDEVRKKPGALPEASETVRKFNQALNLAQTGSEDFAIVELSDITRRKPNYLKAELLLAILYMQEGDFIKAGGALMKVLEIDKNHPLGTVLMDEVKHATGKADVEKAKLKNAYRHRELQDDVVIIPASRPHLSPDRATVMIAAGIIIGLLFFYILILPGIERNYIQALNDNIVENSEEISALNQAYSLINDKYEKLLADYEETNERLEAYEEENYVITSTYENLNKINEYLEAGDYISAAAIYLEIDRESITADFLLSQLQEVDRELLNSGYETIVSMGSDHWNAGSKDKAEDYYRLALSIKPDDPEAMYLLARLLQSEDRIAEANEIFDKIVGEHPESRYADRAINARGY